MEGPVSYTHLDVYKRQALKKTSGIVLIDEVDLSLHPTWQKRIMGILKEQFPRIQFICATHSPFIIQSLEEGELLTLDPVSYTHLLRQKLMNHF